MTSKDKKRLQGDLAEVIEVSKKIRDFMVNTDIPLAERKQEIATFRTANESNKVIVSSIINTIAIEKMGE